MQRLEGRQRSLAHGAVLLGRDVGRANLGGGACLIFGFVVVKALFGNDFNGRKRLAADNADRKFSALDVLLDDDFALAVGEGFPDRLLKVLARLDNGDADAGAAGAGLDNAGKNLPAVGFFDALENFAARCEHLVLNQNALGESLVHRQRRAEIARAGVFESQQVKGRLQLTVLALAAVQGKKRDVRAGADVDDVFADKAVGFVAAILADLVDIRNGLADLGGVGEAVVLLEQLVNIQNVLFVAREHVEQHHVVPFFSQCGGNQQARRNRNVAFGAGAACQNNYSHNTYPLFLRT